MHIRLPCTCVYMSHTSQCMMQDVYLETCSTLVAAAHVAASAVSFMVLSTVFRERVCTASALRSKDPRPSINAAISPRAAQRVLGSLVLDKHLRSGKCCRAAMAA